MKDECCISLSLVAFSDFWECMAVHEIHLCAKKTFAMCHLGHMCHRFGIPDPDNLFISRMVEGMELQIADFSQCGSGAEGRCCGKCPGWRSL